MPQLLELNKFFPLHTRTAVEKGGALTDLEKDKPHRDSYTIYKMTSPSGKSYIGLAQKPLWLRVYEHLEAAAEEEAAGKKSSQVIMAALRHYRNIDTEWKFEILCYAKNQNEARQLEREAIDKHNTLVPNGYNMVPGGEIGDNERMSRRAQKKREEEMRERNKLHHCLFEHAEKKYETTPNKKS